MFDGWNVLKLKLRDLFYVVLRLNKFVDFYVFGVRII